MIPVYLKIDIFDYDPVGPHKNGTQKVGEAVVNMPVLPQVEMHIGESQLVTVCQIHFIVSNLGDRYLVWCKSISCVDMRNHPYSQPNRQFKNLEELQATIEEHTNLKWTWTDAEPF